MDFDCCDTVGEFENVLKGFTRAWVSTGPRGCSNATTDRNIDITRSVRGNEARQKVVSVL